MAEMEGTMENDRKRGCSAAPAAPHRRLLTLGKPSFQLREGHLRVNSDPTMPPMWKLETSQPNGWLTSLVLDQAHEIIPPFYRVGTNRIVIG